MKFLFLFFCIFLVISVFMCSVFYIIVLYNEQNSNKKHFMTIIYLNLESSHYLVMSSKSLIFFTYS